MSVVYLHFILKVKIVLYLGVVTILCEYEGQYSFYGRNINFLLSFIKPCVTKHQAVSIGPVKIQVIEMRGVGEIVKLQNLSLIFA